VDLPQRHAAGAFQLVRIGIRIEIGIVCHGSRLFLVRRLDFEPGNDDCKIGLSMVNARIAELKNGPGPVSTGVKQRKVVTGQRPLT
jgi:hypothetical protein